MSKLRLLLLLSSSLAYAVEPTHPQPMLAHVEIARGKTITEQAVYLANDGEVDETSPTSSTRVKLRLLRTPDGNNDLAFELQHSGADHASWSTRGEIVVAPGKRVLVARVAEPSGPVEVYLSVAPYAR